MFQIVASKMVPNVVILKKKKAAKLHSLYS